MSGTEGVCFECGARMVVGVDGVSHHLTDDDGVDHDADGRHVAYLDVSPEASPGDRGRIYPGMRVKPAVSGDPYLFFLPGPSAVSGYTGDALGVDPTAGVVERCDSATHVSVAWDEAPRSPRWVERFRIVPEQKERT